jgi:titin
MLTTLYVTTAADNGNNAAPTAGSLRAAILQADAQPAGTFTTIDFKIGTGPQVIHPPVGLPEITRPVIIDGTTQPGYAGKPIVDIDGLQAGAGANGLDVETTASGTSAAPGLIRGLEITDFNGGAVSVQASYFNLNTDYIGAVVIGTGTYVESNGVFGVQLFNGASHDTIANSTVAATSRGSGVVITGSGTSYDTLSGDFIGTDPLGKFSVDVNGLSLGNSGSGVQISGGAAHNTISTSVISNNGQQGVYITDAGTSFNALTGDFVGTDMTGGYALPNHAHGVLITSYASQNTLGGTSTSARDVISGNALNGVALSVGDSLNTVLGDYIGVNAAGTAALPNGASGVFFSGSSSDTVGGSSAGARNVISGNSGYGVWIAGSTRITVDGDYIGTDSTGANRVPNNYGVVVNSGSTNNTIGGTSSGYRDVISGNATWGVYISDSGTKGNVVEGDYIGTNAAGTGALPNGYNGLDIVYGATYNTVGGTTAGARDVISGNSYEGVLLGFSSTSYNVVEGDYIGTDYTGTKALANGQDGVQIIGGASGNTLGGTTAAARDVISGNAQHGVLITDSGTSGNVVEDDFIGTDYTGARSVPNATGLTIINGATANYVSGSSATLHNVISGNSWDGVQIYGSGTSNNVVTDDFIGLNAAGTGALGNPASGVYIAGGATGNTVGGTTALARNVISANGVFGVLLSDSGTSGNLVAGNFVGTDATGKLPVPNGDDGVAIRGTASNNTIGGPNPSYRNIISGNARYGVNVTDPGTTGNTVQYNFVGTDVTGEAPVSNGQDGVVVQNGASYTYVYNDLISANGFAGVLVTGTSTNNNFLTSNWIGLDATGLKAVKQVGQAFSNATGVVISGAYNTSVGSNFISGNTTGVYVGAGATSNWIVYDNIGTGADGVTNVGNLQDGVILDGVTNNLVGYSLLVYNGDVGILGENGSTPDNNSLVSDTFTITVNGITYGNKNGATDFD